VLAWLHDHATEVQALAAVIQGAAAIVVALLTYHLVNATRRYVKLTTDLATTARGELEMLVAQRTARAMRLRTLVWQLQTRVAHLPTDFRFEVERLHDLRTLWNAGDLEALQTLGADAGFAESCGVIAERLRALEVHLRPKPTLTGEEINPDDWGQYRMDLKAAKEDLDRLDKELHIVHSARRPKTAAAKDAVES
jgi:hypothetical protein